MRAHRELLLNYFRARKEFSSGVIEGLNNKAKVTMRKAYGFRTFRMTELALYHVLGKLPEPKLTHTLLRTNQKYFIRCPESRPLLARARMPIGGAISTR